MSSMRNGPGMEQEGYSIGVRVTSVRRLSLLVWYTCTVVWVTWIGSLFCFIYQIERRKGKDPYKEQTVKPCTESGGAPFNPSTVPAHAQELTDPISSLHAKQSCRQEHVNQFLHLQAQHRRRHARHRLRYRWTQRSKGSIGEISPVDWLQADRYGVSIRE